MWIYLHETLLYRTNRLASLSVYLFEATSNMTYLNAAKLSHQFMESNLYNNNTGITMDIFSVASCSVANPNAIFSYNTAFHLEGVSALANASRDPVLAELWVL